MFVCGGSEEVCASAGLIEGCKERSARERMLNIPFMELPRVIPPVAMSYSSNAVEVYFRHYSRGGDAS